MAQYIPFLLILMILAAIFREDSILLVFYLIGGIYFVNQWWSRKSLKSITFQRVFTNRAFLGEKIPVRLEITNPSRLPTLWLLIHESLPNALINPNFIRRVVHLQPKSNTSIDYTLYAHKRGFYSVGPLFLHSGDFFGLSNESKRQGDSDVLVVYPQIVNMRLQQVPSHSPYGTIRHKQPVFEDPSRVGGKRPYTPGDSLRRMDWKATAATGQLTIKQYQPSIALETCVFLDLYGPDYEARSRIDTTELAIVAAASLSNWVVGSKQSLGFATNGSDPMASDKAPSRIHPQKGRAQLMRVLDILARIEVGKAEPLARLLARETPYLAWGTTLLVVTGNLDDIVFDELFQARRRGLDISILLVGPVANRNQVVDQAKYFGFPIQTIDAPADLEAFQ